jgi:hypothetical protein
MAPRNRINIIEYLISEIKDLGYVLERCNVVIEKLDGPELAYIYKQEVLGLVEEYKKVTLELVKDLEEHFEWEASHNEAKNLRLHRIYKVLKEKTIPSQLN